MVSDRQDIIFCSFASGSSGNCYYLGTRERGILIDAGISTRAIHKHLKALGLDFCDIAGVLITHDHADHIRSVGTLGEKIHLPVYATAKIHEGIDHNYGLREKLKTSRRFFEKDNVWSLENMTIRTFDVSHDSTECLGYVIDYHDKRFMIVTDCGEPTEVIEHYMQTANHLVIEANHDERMLLQGTYPTYLKQRILAPTGHQSNEVCGQLLERNYRPGLQNIWLCHLSHENNTPQKAFDTVAGHLLRIGVQPDKDVSLYVLPRLEPSEVFVL